MFDKVVCKDKTHISENSELVETKQETAEVSNKFFLNIVQSLKPEPFVGNINYASLKGILKYRNQPSIKAIRNKCKNRDSFSFIEIDQQEIEKDILKLDANKFRYSNKSCKKAPSLQ